MENSGISFFTYFSVKLTKVDLGQLNRSPTRVVITCLTPVPSSASAATAPKFSITISADAPESFN